MFQDYDAYIADLDAAMESGAEPEVPGLSLPTLDDEDIRYSMDEDTAAEPSDNPPLSPDQSGRSEGCRPRMRRRTSPPAWRRASTARRTSRPAWTRTR